MSNSDMQASPTLKEAFARANRKHFADVLSVLASMKGSFAKNTINILTTDGVGALGVLRQGIVGDIYARSFGRKGSKQYYAAFNRWYRLLATAPTSAGAYDD